jgi:fluoride ion exporter CrcB/FEX
MPFGLSGALTTFQTIFFKTFILVFFNDILIYSYTLNLHINYLMVVLKILKDNQLFAKQ